MKQFVILLIITLISINLSQAQTNEKWLKDYEAMKKYMSEAYANLEWARKKIDLVELDKKTIEELKKVASDQEAKQVLDKFLKTFQDGHLKLTEVKTESNQSNNETQSFSPDTPGNKVCSEIGFKFRFNRFSLPFENIPNYQIISTNKDYFLSGIFSLQNGKRFGVLNINLFSHTGFWNNCLETWEEFRTKLTEDCKGECLEKFYFAAANHLSTKLTEQIKVLQENKIDILIVDIGGNGGGTNWVEPAARIISPKPIQSTFFSFIRHPHWVKILEENLQTISDDLARKDLTKQQINYLKTAKSLIEKHLAEAKNPCDRMHFWITIVEQKNCTLLNTTPALTSGVFEKISSKEIANLKSKDILFKSNDYEFEESVYKGKLIVLVDRKTASAAENFASYIQATKSGAVIGEKTLGAGCGYVNGGTQYFLPNSKLKLDMPDCVRYRADGVNEVEGIKPDVQLWETNDDKPQKMEKLLTYLSKVQ